MSTYTSPACSCIICKREMSQKAIFTHYQRSHGTDQQKQKFKSGFTTEERMMRKPQDVPSHYYKQCPQCNTEFVHRYNKFCSHSCSATYSNAHRDKSCYQKNVDTMYQNHPEWKIKKDQQLLKPKRVTNTNKMSKQKFRNSIDGPYTLLKLCKCKMCSKVLLKPSTKKYCSECKSQYTHKRSQYLFKFNVYQYPELFDLSLLQEKGWYAPGGKTGKWNLQGLSRDHRVTVDNAIRNNYDPYYIKHPINCKLIPHSENNKKKTKSDITYEQLKTEVIQYELQRCGYMVE